ncbi:glycosyltransferase family 39 protein [Candidatus Woesebacteria bacterium]|nr:glycosyltransferase family 39 protein [Candidatus Woesebacteria bacterium]
MFVKKLNINLEKVIFLIILVIGIGFRFIGVYPGYPHHSDEAAYSSALTMILNKNLDPARYDYPSGAAIINYLFFKLLFIPFGWLKFYVSSLWDFVDGFLKFPLSTVDYQRIFSLTVLGPQQINTLYWGRYIAAGFGVGIIFLTYLLSKKIFNIKVGLISSFLVAVNYRQVLNSHLGLQDIYNGFFLLLTLYLIYLFIEKPSKKNYIFAGIFNGIFFSIKFQVFGFVALFAGHLIGSFNKSLGWMANFKRLFLSRNLLISLLTSIFTVLLINPYHLINFELFKDTQIYVFSKYGGGANVLNVYPISYLYHIGIGEILSILTLLGFVLTIIKYFRKSLIINLAIFQFLLTFFYLTRGGFYTRNFVTVTPLLLILASIFILDFSSLIFTKLIPKFKGRDLMWGICLALFLFIISFNNIKYSYMVLKVYTKEWNEKIIAEWVNKNIPQNATVSAHSNTPIPEKDSNRLIYEPDVAFSLDEFAAQNADYAISNSAWSTNSFYWWMGGDPVVYAKHYWNKPLDILEYSYPAIALRELEQYAVYIVSKPWIAPDVDFMVVKIPKFKVLSTKLIESFDFKGGQMGWIKDGKFWLEKDNLTWKSGELEIQEEPLLLPSIRWSSEPIETLGWNGFKIEYSIKSESTNKNLKTGYIFVSFYNNSDDARNSRNRIGVRLSERANPTGSWLKENLIGKIPEGARYMTIGFSNYAPNQSLVSLSNVNVYKADVDVDLGGWKVGTIKIDQNNLYPNSHGNL